MSNTAYCHSPFSPSHTKLPLKTQKIISENRADIQLSEDSRHCRVLARTLSVGSPKYLTLHVVVVGKNLLGSEISLSLGNYHSFDVHMPPVFCL
jgi:hypothetical protein